MWKEKAIEELRRWGYKLTPQRLKLLEVLEELGSKHPAMTEVLARIREEFPTVSFSTLYSNLLTLRELGLVELFSLDGETRVELNTKPHLNLIHGEEVTDLDDEEIIEAIKRKVGRNVRLVNVVLD
ncbi:transcriptional repressor [Thermococcus sp. AM4]|uniref:transcriptional repressor n=1 Tax=Thermococcus sp. (strain AM4) TaxID=246969 RepID=UPI0001870A7F|nr:transcriptional repressor [Thermococcus sp. AM4]EEB73356.1 FurR family transcriptional regulator [Thermococcus sp. AM4]